MKITLTTYRCAACQNEFKAPPINPPGYGQFFLRSAIKGMLRHLNALTNPAFNEVDTLLKSSRGLAISDELLRSKILREIFGEVACDRDIDGDIFRIGGMPACPTCASNQMESWSVTDPAEVVDIDVPEMTNDLWDKLSDQEKIQRLPTRI